MKMRWLAAFAAIALWCVPSFGQSNIGGGSGGGVTPGLGVNPISFGAKIDTVAVFDATITNGSSTIVTSATDKAFVVGVDDGGKKKCLGSLCDRTDDIPMQGSLGIQQNGVSDSFTFAADGSVSVNLSIDMSADPVTFTVFLTDANGNQAQGSGWTWSFPRASVKAGVASIGTFKFGGLAFTKNSDGSVSFAGFL